MLTAAGADGLPVVPPECGPLRLVRNALKIDAVRRPFVFARLPDAELALDIYYPRTAKPAAGFPVILWIHGGGWVLGSKRQDVFVRHFPRYGYAVVSIEYRLALGANFPDQMLDVRLATRWILDHARELDLDPGRIVLSGQSAGGHLALLAAYTEGRDDRGWGPTIPRGTIKGVAAMYPPTDLLALVPVDAWDNPVHPVALLLGGEIRQRLPLARAASPVTYAHPGAPPTLLLHGTEDSIVPPEQSELLHRRLRAVGAKSSLQLVPGGHAFTLYPDHVDAVRGFLQAIPALTATADEARPAPSRPRRSAVTGPVSRGTPDDRQSRSREP